MTDEHRFWALAGALWALERTEMYVEAASHISVVKGLRSEAREKYGKETT